MTPKYLIFAIFSTLWLNFGLGSIANPTFSSEIRLSGTLVSTNGRSALVNGRMVREGDRISGVRILAIDEHSIRVQSGYEQTVLRIGATADLEPAAAAVAQEPRPTQPAAAPSTPRPAAAPAQGPPQSQVARARRVERGDTLSEIARNYVVVDVTLDQIMLAIFQANPEAFGNNINRLYAGAELRIPTIDVFVQYGHAQARTEVARQTIAWQHERHESLAKRQNLRAPGQIMPSTYGPVQPGETLSEIAASLRTHDIPTSRMMLALFDENPTAFREDMNLLLSGATLRVPSREAIFSRTMAHLQFR